MPHRHLVFQLALGELARNENGPAAERADRHQPQVHGQRSEAGWEPSSMGPMHAATAQSSRPAASSPAARRSCRAAAWRQALRCAASRQFGRRRRAAFASFRLIGLAGRGRGAGQASFDYPAAAACSFHPRFDFDRRCPMPPHGPRLTRLTCRLMLGRKATSRSRNKRRSTLAPGRPV